MDIKLVTSLVMSLLHSTHWAIGKIEELQQKEWLKNKKNYTGEHQTFYKINIHFKGI